jgi:hypothetical protein
VRQELDEALVRDFPLLYRDRHGDMRSTCMVWGFPGDGWEPLIRRLSERLEPMIAAMPDDCGCGHPRAAHPGPTQGPDPETYDVALACIEYHDGRPCASQVKEKFGMLSFYMTSETEEMTRAIQEVEAESARTCESCGGPGGVVGEGWLRATCGPCDEADKKRREEELAAYEARRARSGREPDATD